jgi:hypothetical protein
MTAVGTKAYSTALASASPNTPSAKWASAGGSASPAISASRTAIAGLGAFAGMSAARLASDGSASASHRGACRLVGPAGRCRHCPAPRKCLAVHLSPQSTTPFPRPFSGLPSLSPAECAAPAPLHRPAQSESPRKTWQLEFFVAWGTVIMDYMPRGAENGAYGEICFTRRPTDTWFFPA